MKRITVTVKSMTGPINELYFSGRVLTTFNKSGVHRLGGHLVQNPHGAVLGRRLRVVQTQAILFLKSMSERVGSDLKTTLKSKDEFLDRLKIY